MAGDGETGDATFTKDDLEARVAEEVANLKGALQKERDDRREAKEQVQELRDSLQEAQKRMQELEHTQKGSKAGMDEDAMKKLRADIRADLEREYAPLKEKVGEFEQALQTKDGEIRELRLDNVVKARMGKVGVRGDRVDALFKLVGDQFDLTDDGEPILKDNREVPLEKYLAEQLADEYPEFYNGSGSSGGGASKSSGGSAGRRVVAADDEDAFLANVEAIASGEVEVR